MNPADAQLVEECAIKEARLRDAAGRFMEVFVFEVGFVCWARRTILTIPSALLRAASS